MKLYSGPLSLFTGKVRIALDEKGLACELVSVPFDRTQGYQPKHPDVLAINPKGQVPVLVDGEVELFDSTIILEYLEDRYPDPALYPRNVGLRADQRGLLPTVPRGTRRAARRPRSRQSRAALRRSRAPARRAGASLRRLQRRRHRLFPHDHVCREPRGAARRRPRRAAGLVRTRPRPASRDEGGPRSGRGHGAARDMMRARRR